MLGANSRYQLVLLSLQPAEVAFLPSNELQEPPDQRRHGGTTPGSADPGAIIQVIVHRYCDILHRNKVSQYHRKVNRKAASRADPVPLEPGWSSAVIQGWLGFEEIVYVAETVACLASLAGLVARGVVARRVWTDADLAAFAMARGLRLVSFDQDFARFERLDFLLLQA